MSRKEDTKVLEIEINSNFDLNFKSGSGRETSYTNWLDYNSDIIDPITGVELASYSRSKSSGKSLSGFYGMNGRLTEKDNVSIAEKDGKIYIERRDKDGRIGLGIFDKAAKVFYTGMVKRSKGEVSIEPCANLEEAKSIIFQGLIADMRLNKPAFNSSLTKLQNNYVAGVTGSLDASIKDEFISELCNAAKRLKDYYFEPREDKDAYRFKTINANITKEQLNSDGAAVLFDGKEFEYFSNIGERSSKLVDDDSALGLVRKFLPKPILAEGEKLSPEQKKAFKNFILNEEKLSQRASALENLGYIPSERDKSIFASMSADIRTNIELNAKGLGTQCPGYYFRGPTGNGKTFLARTFAAMLGKKVANYTCSANTEAMDIFYKDELIDGNSVKSESDILKALRNGDVILIDEVNNMNTPTELDCLNTALANGYFTTPSGELVHVHPEAIIIFCGNQGQSGTQELSSALKSRTKVINLPPISILELSPMSLNFAKNACETYKVDIPETELRESMSSLASVVSSFNDSIFINATTMRGFSSPLYIDTRDLSGAIQAAVCNYAFELKYLGTTDSFSKVLYDTLTSARGRSPLVNINGGDSLEADIIRMINENSYFLSVSSSSTISM